MTCREVTDALHDYVPGDLPPERTAKIDRHLATCADCANYLAAFRQTLTLTTATCDANETRSADLPEALVQAILAARRRQ